MIYVLMLILLIFCIVDFLRKKTFFSPSFIFNFIWFITLCLYQLKLSYIQQNLLNRTILILYICVLSYNLMLILLEVLNIKPLKIKLNYKPKFQIKEKIKYVNLLIIILFIIQVIYSRGVPLIWKIAGNGKTYFDFGIPSLNGAFCGLVICMGAYNIFSKSKFKYLYFAIGILIISRQVLISMVIEALIFAIYNSNSKIKMTYKKLIIIGIISIMCFTMIGNFRSGNKVMDDVFQAKEQYKEIPSSAKWVYSYMTFSLSNFNNLVSNTDGCVNYGASMFKEFLPTVLINKFNIKENKIFNYLISPNYTVSTYLPSIYLDFGLIGIGVFNMIIAFVGYQLYIRMKLKNETKNILLYSVFVHNIIFLFFINMFLYLPIIIQFIYIPLIFTERE